MAMNSVSLHRYIKHVICDSHVPTRGKIIHTCSIDNVYFQITFKYLLFRFIQMGLHRIRDCICDSHN